MCIRPIQILNPLYSRSSYSLRGEKLISLPIELQSNKPTISVPCGTCAECRNSYYNSIIQRGVVESLTSYLYFITLTYDNNHIPSLTLPNGKTIYYCDYKHIQDLFKRLRNHNILDRDFRYLVATEYGDTYHRPHFHILLFVAKKLDDHTTFPLELEKVLFRSIKRYYALNKGSKKRPIYECLFTYRTRRTAEGIKTNYLVKFVDPEIPETMSLKTDSLSYVKTIKYLLSYVNKGSSFDSMILKYLSEINDKFLVSKLKTILSSKLRYSKGFGLGSSDGILNECSRYETKVSSFLGEWSTLDLPSTFKEFAEQQPSMITRLKLFVETTRFQDYDSLRHLSSNFSHYQLLCLILLMNYFPNYFTLVYNRWYRKRYNNDCISYLFSCVDSFRYIKTKVRTSLPSFEFPCSYIRQGVESAINSCVPFIAFPLYSTGQYMPLCKFYRERYTTYEDTLRMYESIGVRNYDEWQSKFVTYVNTNKQGKANANKLLRESERLEQDHCISNNNITDLYEYLFAMR